MVPRLPVSSGVQVEAVGTASAFPRLHRRGTCSPTARERDVRYGEYKRRVHVREDFPDLPPTALALTLRVWGRMHGLMALEIYGHLRALINDPATVYRDEIRDLITSLGLTC